MESLHQVTLVMNERFEIFERGVWFQGLPLFYQVLGTEEELEVVLVHSRMFSWIGIIICFLEDLLLLTCC